METMTQRRPTAEERGKNSKHTKLRKAKEAFEDAINEINKRGNADSTIEKLIAANKRGAVRLVTDSIYETGLFSAGEKELDLVKSANKEDVGIRNSNDGKIQEDNYLLVTHISMEATATAANMTEEDLKTAAFTRISQVPVLKNGEIEMTLDSGKHIVLDQNFPIARFDREADENGYVDTIELINPVIVVPQKKMDISIKLSASLTEDFGVKVALIGYSATLGY